MCTIFSIYILTNKININDKIKSYGNHKTLATFLIFPHNRNHDLSHECKVYAHFKEGTTNVPD